VTKVKIGRGVGNEKGRKNMWGEIEKKKKKNTKTKTTLNKTGGGKKRGTKNVGGNKSHSRGYGGGKKKTKSKRDEGVEKNTKKKKKKKKKKKRNKKKNLGRKNKNQTSAEKAFDYSRWSKNRKPGKCLANSFPRSRKSGPQKWYWGKGTEGGGREGSLCHTLVERVEGSHVAEGNVVRMRSLGVSIKEDSKLRESDCHTDWGENELIKAGR